MSSHIIPPTINMWINQSEDTCEINLSNIPELHDTSLYVAPGTKLIRVLIDVEELQGTIATISGPAKNIIRRVSIDPSATISLNPEDFIEGSLFIHFSNGKIINLLNDEQLRFQNGYHAA